MTYVLDEHGRSGAKSRQAAREPSALLLLGIAAGLVWSIAVEMAGPGSWDPHEACDLRFHQTTHAIISHVFPPRATCVGDHGSFAFIPLETTIVLTVIGALVGLVIALGLKRYGASFFVGAAARQRAVVPDGITRLAPAGVALRLATHVGLATLVGIGAAVFGPLPLLLFGFFGNDVGVGLAAALLLVVITLLTASADVGFGPLAGGAVGSQRRGLALAVLGPLPMLAMCVSASFAPERISWRLPVGTGLAFALLTLIQWAPSLYRRRRAERVR